MAYPKNLGSCIDLLFEMREERIKLQRLAEEMSKKETELNEHILQAFSKTDLEGARGKLATCSIKRSKVPTVDDWEKFYKYVQKNGAFDLLQRRVSAEACRARWEQDVVIPGVKTFDVIKLSLTKASRR